MSLCQISSKKIRQNNLYLKKIGNFFALVVAMKSQDNETTSEYCNIIKDYSDFKEKYQNLKIF